MPLSYRISAAGPDVTLALSGYFTMKENAVFRSALDEITAASPRSLTVDLAGLTMVDSAGLSMLLLLRDRLAREQARMGLRNPPAPIRKLLDIVRFDQLFDVQDDGRVNEASRA